MTRSDAEKNRQIVLEAFGQLVEQSENIPTMSDVVRKSGLGRATVYRHYPDIGSMAFAQLDEGYRQLFSKFRDVLVQSEHTEIEAVLIGFLNDYFLFSQRNRTLLRSPECQSSEAYSVARSTLRQLVFDAIQRTHGQAGNEQALEATAHIISGIAEAEHWPDSVNKSSAEFAVSMIKKLIPS